MALDRQSIQRTDFPLARKGYDPAAVDAHLRAIADEMDTLTPGPKQGETLASSASDHVRTIVEAAETSAAKIRREAESNANAMRERAQQHARRLAASSAAMLERLEATKRELESVIKSLRAQAAGLEAEAASAPDVPQPSTAPAADVPLLPDNGAPAPQPEPAAVEAEPAAPAAAAPAAPESEPAAPAAAAPGPEPAGEPSRPDDDGARLIALHMALNGTPRDETAKYLSEHYQISDRDQLLDEVYASVQP